MISHTLKHCSFQALPSGPKPWVDYHLQTQMHLLESLKNAARKSRDVEDFDKFRLQRAKVDRLNTDLMNVYFRNNPSQVRLIFFRG